MAVGAIVPGPGFGSTLADAELRKMLQRAHREARDKRKRLAAAKREIWDECFHEQIAALIRKRWANPELQRRMINWISLTFNAGKDITRAVAVAYSYGARRYLREASEELEKVWVNALREGNIDGQAISWLRMAFLQGQPPIVVPRVKNGELVREIHLADSYDVITDPSDPTGPLSAVVIFVNDGTNWAQDNTDRVAKVVLDREEWRYFNSRGMEVKGPDGRHAVPHKVKDRHGNPVVPAVPIRLEEPLGYDPYWGATTNDRLLEVTLEIALLWTRLRYLRKAQDSKLVTYFAGVGMDLPPGQVINDPEGGIKVIGAEAGGVQFEVHDLDTSPAHYISEIMAAYSTLVESYGIPASAVTFDWSGGQGGGMESVQPAVSIQVTKEKLNLLRNEQVRFLVPAEQQLAALSASAMIEQRHPKWAQIPPPDEVWDRFVIEFGEIDTIADPKTRREQDQWEREQGMRSRVDLVLRNHPYLTRREAMQMIERKVEEDSKINEFLAKRDMQLGAPATATNAEVNGAMGPEVRDGPPDGSPPNASDEA